MHYILSPRCYRRLGDWQENIQGLTESSIPQVIHYYSKATEHDPGWYKAWHAYAYMNYEAVLFYKQQKSQDDQDSNASCGSGTDGFVMAGAASDGGDDAENVSYMVFCNSKKLSCRKRWNILFLEIGVSIFLR